MSVVLGAGSASPLASVGGRGVAVSSDGKMYAAFQTSAQQIAVFRSDNNGATWTDTNFPAVAGYAQSRPVLAVTTDGGVHCVWVGPRNYAPSADMLWHRRYDPVGGSWSNEYQIVGGTNRDVVCAALPTGALLVGWVSASSQAFYGFVTRASNGTWSNATAVSSPWGSSAILYTGCLWISGSTWGFVCGDLQPDSGGTRARRVLFATSVGGGAWTIETGLTVQNFESGIPFTGTGLTRIGETGLWMISADIGGALARLVRRNSAGSFTTLVNLGSWVKEVALSQRQDGSPMAIVRSTTEIRVWDYNGTTFVDTGAIETGLSSSDLRGVAISGESSPPSRPYIFGVGAVGSVVVRAGVFIYNAPPIEPTNLSRDNYDAVEAAEFTWQHNDPDGDPQHAYRLEIRRASDNILAYDSEKVISGVSAHQLPADTIANDTDYNWRVKTWDTEDQDSPWSGYAQFRTISKPSVNITMPQDMAVLLGPDVLVSWEYFDLNPDGYQVAFQVVVTDLGGVYLDTGKVESGADSFSVTELASDDTYTIEVRVWNPYDVASLYDSVTISTDYTPPDAPSVEVVPMGHYLRVEVTNAITGVAAVENWLYKLIENQWVRVAVLGLNAAWEDYAVASGHEVGYRVAAVAANGGRAFSAVVSGSVSLRGVWLHSSQAPSAGHNFRADAWRRQVQHDTGGIVMELQGRAKPVVEFGVGDKRTIHVEITSLDDDDISALYALYALRGVLCYRDGRGRLEWVSIVQFPSIDEQHGRVFQMVLHGVSYSEVV